MRRGARAGLAAMVALVVPPAGAALLASCNLIVGVGDFSVGDGGAVATGDSGRKDARAEAAVKCGEGIPTTPDFEQLVQSCVYAESCDPNNFDVNISYCVTYNYLQDYTGVACLSTITSCDLYYDCQGTGLTTSSDCPGDSGSTCNGNVALNCAQGIKENCAKLGGSCGLYDAGEEAGTTAGCVVVDSCPETDGGSFCQGTDSYQCLGGKGYGQDCQNIPATCLEADGGTFCEYQAPSCSTPGSNKCSNAGTLEACTTHKQSVKFDCTRANESCIVDDAGDGFCVSPGCSVNNVLCDQDTDETCDEAGVTMTVCVGTAPYKIDCSKIPGFTNCAMNLNGIGFPYTYCY
jgi:hypothetical protein